MYPAYQFDNLKPLLKAVKNSGYGINLLRSHRSMDGKNRLDHVGAAVINLAMLPFVEAIEV